MKLIHGFEFKDQAIGETNNSHFQLRIIIPKIEQMRLRKPLNLALVIDRSGSMNGDKLKYVKEAVKTFVHNLSSQDILSLVMFDNNVHLLRSAEYVKNKNEIYDIIDKIVSGRTTNLSGGWMHGCKEIMSAQDKIVSDEIQNHVNRLILLTDGLANEGITDKKVLVELGNKYLSNNIETTTIGVGNDFDEELLKSIANASKGNFYFIENPDQAPEIFTEEVGELLSLHSQNLELILKFLNGVQLEDLLTDYPVKNKDKTSVTLELDDAYSEDEKSILLKLDFPAVHQLGSYEVINVRLKYNQIIPCIEEKSVVMTFSRTVITKDEFKVQTPDENVLMEIALVKAAVDRLKSYELLKKGDVNGASGILIGTSVELQCVSDTLLRMGAIDKAESVQFESETLKKDNSEVTNYGESYSKHLYYDAHKLFRKKGDKKSKKKKDEDEN